MLKIINKREFNISLPLDSSQKQMIILVKLLFTFVFIFWLQKFTFLSSYRQ
jgi:hypothetical protein